MVVLLVSASCAGEGIFDPAPTSTDESAVVFPNPIAVDVSATSGKLYVLNSDGEVAYTTGSFAQVSVDATDTDNPVLTIDAMVTVEQFAADMVLDESFAYITSRFSSVNAAAGTPDHLYKLQIDDASLTTVDSATVGPNPFGITLDGGELFVASDEQVDRLRTEDLETVATLDLSDITDVNTQRIEDVALDPDNGWLFVSNRGDELLVIDTDDNTLDYRIEGPNNTRGVAFGNGRVYVLEGTPASLLVFDTSALAKQETTQLVGDATVPLLATIPVGDNPCKVALDLTRSRAYTSNMDSNDISVIDIDLLESVATVSLDEDDIQAALADGEAPCGLAVADFNGVPYVIVANYESNNLSIINANTLSVVSTFPN